MSNARELAELGGAYSTGGYPHFKNRIINGDMRIDQRNAGASVTPTTTINTFDRWLAGMNVASKYSVRQMNASDSGASNYEAASAPSGFTNSMKITSTSAYSVAAGELFYVGQRIEGFNVADLGWGTSGAQAITISFQVKSSLTGTFGGSVANRTFDRSYPFTYSIAAANTWETKTITIVGDTSGAWDKGNTTGLVIHFGLGVGSTYSGTAGAWSGTGYVSATGATSVVGTSGATFYITGVQLEKGSTATSFDYRGTELALCQRYFISYGGQQLYEPFGLGVMTSTSNGAMQLSLPVSMRVPPTSLTAVAPTSFLLGDGVSTVSTTGITLDTAGNQQVMFNAACGGGLTAGRGCRLFSNNTTNTRIQISAEL